MIMRLACAGGSLGLSAAWNNIRYEVTAETLTPTILKSIRREDFLEFLWTYLEVDKKVSQVMAKESGEMFLHARRLALSGSASGRLARLLLDWAAFSDQPAPRLTVALTQREDREHGWNFA